MRLRLRLREHFAVIDMTTDLEVLAVYRLDCQVFEQDRWSFESVSKVRELGFGLMTDDRQGYCLVHRREVYDELVRIGVLESARRQGLGELLLRAVIERSPARFQTLMVRADNEPAKALYRRFGFLPMGMLPSYYRGNIDGVVMGRDAKMAA